MAPLTVGHWKVSVKKLYWKVHWRPLLLIGYILLVNQNENGVLHNGRRDFRLPGFPRFNPHFQGDIKEISIWKHVLTKQNMRVHARDLLRRMGNYL